MVDTYQKLPEEIYNEALINLGMSHLNVNGGVHPGLNNLFPYGTSPQPSEAARRVCQLGPPT